MSGRAFRAGLVVAFAFGVGRMLGIGTIASLVAGVIAWGISEWSIR